MVIACRPLGPADQLAAAQLGHLSFGYPPPKDASELPPERENADTYGAFDDGRLVAIARDLHQAYRYGGADVPACGVASVAVAAESRGTGVAQQLLRALLAGARERGAVVSALYPTAPGLYRRLGWEQAGVLRWLTLPTRAFAAVRRPDAVVLRRAEPADAAAVRAMGAAAAENGALLRADPLGGVDGVTLAERDGEVVGFCAWDRGHGYHADSVLTVDHLVAADAEATAALAWWVGSWASVAPTVSLKVAAADPVHWLLPWGVPEQGRTEPWMLRLVDAAAAFAARPFPTCPDVAVDLELTDPDCPWNAGLLRLVVEGGRAALTPGGSGAVQLGPRGLALLWAGGVTAAQLRRGGLLAGDETGLRALDAVAAGPAPALLDYF